MSNLGKRKYGGGAKYGKKRRTGSGITFQYVKRTPRWIAPGGMPEKKFLDMSDGGVGVADLRKANPNYWCVNGIAVGTGPSERVGRKVKIHSLQFRVTMIRAANEEAHMQRVMVVWDKQANGTTLTNALLLAPQDAATNNWILKNNLLDNRDRFVVLYDKYRMLGESDNTADNQRFMGNPIVFWQKFIKFPKEKMGADFSTTFGGNGATAADITTGSLWLVIMSDDDDAGDNKFWFQSRVRYTDM